MGRLSELPNIGKTMEKRLAAIGINDIETLKKIGSKEAFIKLRLHEGDTCLCSLYGLEGAIQGISWHNLSSESKEDLKKFLRVKLQEETFASLGKKLQKEIIEKE